MKSQTTALVLSASLAAAAALAVPQHTEVPKPGPEVKKLDVFAGKWKGESEMKPGPWGPGGKMTSEDDCKWFEGGFALECHGDGNGAMGKVKSEFVLGWNPEEKVYKYMGWDSTGMMGTANGKVSGNTWTYTGEDKMGGKMIKSRYTIVVASPTTHTFKWETSDDGGKTWKMAAEGKSTKQ
jgi:uncharacterized protein DUF1579